MSSQIGEARILQALREIQKESKIISASAPSSPGATEATAIAILNATIASDQDIEILLVRDTVTLTVYQQIVNYETGIPVITYKDVNGVDFTPVNPMEYLDPSTVLNLILTELQKPSNLKAIVNNADDMVKTFTWYSGVVVGENPSGNKNVSTIVYSSTALGLSVTEKFKYDSADDVLTIELL
jgi:hypothetical protein